MSLPVAAFVAQLATTLPLVGLIWFVQVVAYPLFARVDAASFAGYHRAHARLITFVVAPLMLGELAAAAVWLWAPLPGLAPGLAWLGLGLTVLAWLVTLLASVPAHQVLERGFDAAAHHRLVATNWLRTLAWTARGALLLGIVGQAFG